MSWVINPKLKAILNTYHAPYKPKQQYWTGLLLLIRCALFFVFAFNSTGDDNINLLVTTLATSGILIWFSLSSMIYKSWHLNALEVSFILNLGTLAVATYHMKLSGGSQAAVAYTSVGIAFLIFVEIVICHIYMRIKSKVNYIQWGRQLQHKNGKRHMNNNLKNFCEGTPNAEHPCQVIPNVVTHTEVDLREL